jgi:cellobiose phosphorylase
VQWILGVRTSLDGLEIAPVIPKSWPGFTATRTFRGVVYRISIERKDDGNHIALTVDGLPIEGNIVPPPADGRKEVLVKGILSKGPVAPAAAPLVVNEEEQFVPAK